MAQHFRDGSIVTSNIPLYQRKSANQRKYGNFSIVKARVDEVVYGDDNRNTTFNTANKQVEYICTILGGVESGKKLFGVINSSMFGGVNNFGEIIRTPMSDDDFAGSTPKTADVTRGEIVLIARIHGMYSSNVIIGAVKHPKSKTIATKNDGQRVMFEYNGIKVTIDKNGGLSLTNTGGVKDKNGNPTNSQAAGSSISLAADGTMAMSKGSQKISMDNQGQIMMKAPNGGEMSLDSSGKTTMKSQTTDLQAKNALNVKSTLTSIGQGGTPSARIGDVAIGTGNEGFPVISRIINGSFITMMGS